MMKVVEHPVGSILGEEELEAIRRVLASGQSLAGAGTEFEDEFRQYCGAKHAVALSSCTAALHLAAQVLRLGPDDEVVCTPLTFWATVIALVGRGVHIRFADIDPDTLNIDPATIEAQITPRTRAIYLVHLGGNPADMDPIREIAQAHDIAVVEDCAHAAGSEYKGQKIGNGDLCCFAFSSLKNMVTLGEGGMLTTNNEQWASEAAALRGFLLIGETTTHPTVQFGPYTKPDFLLSDHSGNSWETDWVRIEEAGTNYRMSRPQAEVGRVQLRKLDSFNAVRERIAQRFNEAVASIPGLRPLKILDGCKSSWHLYTCFVEPDSGVDRNALIRYMQEVHGVQIILRYWPLHLNPALRMAGHDFGECPVCEKVWFEQQFSLPICPTMEDWEVDAAIEALAEGMNKFCK